MGWMSVEAIFNTMVLKTLRAFSYEIKVCFTVLICVFLWEMKKRWTLKVLFGTNRAIILEILNWLIYGRTSPLMREAFVAVSIRE